MHAVGRAMSVSACFLSLLCAVVSQTVVVEKLPGKVLAGQRTLIDCIGPVSPQWEMGETSIEALHPTLYKDEFLRRRYEKIEQKLNDTTSKITLVLEHPSLEDNSRNFFCVSGDVKTRASFEVIPVWKLANPGSRVNLSCEGVQFDNVTLNGPVVWTRGPNGNETEVITCEDSVPTTTSTSTTTTPTTTSTTTITPPAQPAANDTTVPPPDLSTETSRSKRDVKKATCEGVAKISIDSVVDSDDSLYTCTCSFKVDGDNNRDDKSYAWSTRLYVKVKPNAPSVPWLENNTVNSLIIRWNASAQGIANQVSYYKVESVSLYTYVTLLRNWKELEAHSKMSGNINSTVTRYEISGLLGETKYVARVIAYNEIGHSIGVENITLQTAKTRPPKPNLYSCAAEDTKVKLIWSVEKLDKNYTAFRVLFYSNSSKTALIKNKTIEADLGPGDKYYLTVDNLTAVNPYYYCVLTLNGEDSSSEGQCSQCPTDISSPEAPVISKISTTAVTNVSASVTIVFDPPKCIVLSPDCLDWYRLEYRAHNSTSERFNATTFGKDKKEMMQIASIRNFSLTSLPLGHSYELKLAGVVESKVDSSKNITGPFSKSVFTQYFVVDVPSEAPPSVTEREQTTLLPDDNSTLVTIIAVSVCGVLIVTCLIVSVVVYRKRKERGNMSVDMEDDLWIDLNTPLLKTAAVGYVENVYENTAIDQWAEHCKLMHANSDIKFTEEYDSICQTINTDTTWRDSLEPANMAKNRYNNIVAYDHSRVVLKTLPGVVHSDYINANFIDSYDRTRAFIATQGPLPNTIEDFWRMVYENHCSVIVMITNVYEKHKKKCEKYWPDSGEVKYGRLTVSAMGVEELAHWTIRRFTIKYSKVSKKKHAAEKIVWQYHYTEWPDHGIPEYTFPVLSFVKRACASNPPHGGPIVVHCSAGVGRTGTFIVLEAMMKQITQKRSVNVQCFLRHIRSLRNHMVQTEDQYIFIHDALLNFIESAGRTDIQPKKFRSVLDELDTNFDTSGETILEKQYKTIVKWSAPSHLTNVALLDVNQNKNRSLSFIPLDNSSRVKLPKVAGENGSDYINATYLHGYFQNREYITTQHPSTVTEYDFWRMVWDQNSMTIVMLSNIGEEDLITFFRPKGEVTDWSHKSSFKLTFTQEKLELDYVVRDFQLESTQDDYEMLARMFSITCWPEAYTDSLSAADSTSADGVFQFIEVVNQWHATQRNQTGPIIVIDKYGGKVAAQFCALYTLYNQYHSDTTVDIYSMAYLYHMKRPGVWENSDDYRLLYNCMLQLFKTPAEEPADSSSCARLDQHANTFANVRRINTLSRSPEHVSHTDTL